MCPECKRQISQTATACPKCGFVLNEGTRQELITKAGRQKRGCLITLAVVLLLCAGPCVIGPFGKHPGHIVGSGYDKRWVSPAEEEAAGWKFFWLGLVVLVLPSAGIAAYLYKTKQKSVSRNQR